MGRSLASTLMRSLGKFWVKEPVADVFRLGTPYVGFYLLAEGGKYTLVDSGLPGYRDLLLRFLAKRGSRLADVEAQILTHHHPEHRGNTAHVQERTGSPSYVHTDDASGLEKRAGLPKGPVWRPAVLKYFAHLLINGFVRTRPVVDAQTFEDGTVLDVPGRPRLIHVPGHTEGHCCLLIESKGAVVTGHALVAMDLETGQPGWRIAPSFTNEDSHTALESLRRLEKLDAEHVLTAHGPSRHQAIEAAVREARAVGVH